MSMPLLLCAHRSCCLRSKRHSRCQQRPAQMRWRSRQRCRGSCAACCRCVLAGTGAVCFPVYVSLKTTCVPDVACVLGCMYPGQCGVSTVACCAIMVPTLDAVVLIPTSLPLTLPLLMPSCHFPCPPPSQVILQWRVNGCAAALLWSLLLMPWC